MPEISENIESLIDGAVNLFLKGSDKTQDKMFSGVLRIVKNLDLNPDGSVKQTAKNMKNMIYIRSMLSRVIRTNEYIRNVNKFTDEFTAVKELNDEYFTTLSDVFNANKGFYNEILNQEIQITKNSLIEAGIDENIIKPVENVIKTNIGAGGQYKDLVEQLRTEILGDQERLGNLMRYSKQIAWDSIAQFNRNYSQAVTEDLGMEWFVYSTGLIADSRSYCRKRVGKYFHKKEVQDSARLKWEGKAKGTNASNIFTYAGGYNCRHEYRAVLTEQVPKNGIERNIRNGNYKENSKKTK